MITQAIYTGDLALAMKVAIAAVVCGLVVGITAWLATLVGLRNFEGGDKNEEL